jgi:hypothetical protein
VLATLFWPTAKQDIINRTINPIVFFGTIILIPIYLLLHFGHVIAHPVPLGFAASLVEELPDAVGNVGFGHLLPLPFDIGTLRQTFINLLHGLKELVQILVWLFFKLFHNNHYSFYRGDKITQFSSEKDLLNSRFVKHDVFIWSIMMVPLGVEMLKSGDNVSDSRKRTLFRKHYRHFFAQIRAVTGKW